jgi:hypothetical protein
MSVQQSGWWVQEYDKPLTAIHVRALRCHAEPGEVLTCREGSDTEHVWVHTQACTEQYFEARDMQDATAERMAG